MESKGGTRLDRVKLRLIGSPCGTCISSIRRELEKLNGVEWVAGNTILDLIFVDFDPDTVDADEILGVVRRSGYRPVRVST